MRTSFVFLALLAQASATPVLFFNPAGASSGNENDQTIGWTFNVVSTITVGGLGWYDPSGTGLALSHMVGIWDSAGTLLASATVQSGTTNPLDGLFRTVSITPITLTPGSGYTVGGQNFFANTDQLAFNVTPTTIPSITFVNGVFSAIDGIFERPTNLTGNANCCWGPSFSTVTVAAVPEPGSGTLLAVASCVMIAAAFRKRARRFFVSRQRRLDSLV